MVSLRKLWDDLTGQTQETERTTSVNQANIDIANQTNKTNREIAEQNLQFQRENLDYQKELQQQIFEREDTAYQRTKQDMINAGLNPLSMQSTNGSGEAIATTPLNNNFQAQMPAPMQKENTLDSPLQHILNILGTSTSVAGAISNISQMGLRRDLLQSQIDSQNIDNLIKAKSHGVDLKNGIVENPHNWNQNDWREYRHKVAAVKYDSDSNPERIVTALLDALNGRYDNKVNDVKENIREKVPLIDKAIEYEEKDNLRQSQKERAESKGYVLGKGQTTTTVIPHPVKGYNTIKVYNIKGKLIDMYDVDYEGNIINKGTKVNSSFSSHKSGKF